MKTNYEMEIKQAEARKFQLQKHLQEVAVKTFRNEADNVEDGRINDMYEKTLQIAIKFQQIENKIKECDMEIEVLNRLQQQEEKKEENTTEEESYTSRAVKVIVDEIEYYINGYYRDWEINSWNDFLDAIGNDSSDWKDNVYYLLNHAEINGYGYIDYTDDCEIIERDGTVVSYRKLMNKVRKELGWD